MAHGLYDDELPSVEHRHLAHPNADAPWVPLVTLCGERIVVGMSYREVGVGADNADVECCDRCDFALFVERNEMYPLPVGTLIEKVA